MENKQYSDETSQQLSKLEHGLFTAQSAIRALAVMHCKAENVEMVHYYTEQMRKIDRMLCDIQRRQAQYVN